MDHPAFVKGRFPSETFGRTEQNPEIFVSFGDEGGGGAKTVFQDLCSSGKKTTLGLSEFSERKNVQSSLSINSVFSSFNKFIWFFHLYVSKILEKTNSKHTALCGFDSCPSYELLPFLE